MERRAPEDIAKLLNALSRDQLVSVFASQGYLPLYEQQSKFPQAVRIDAVVERAVTEGRDGFLWDAVSAMLPSNSFKSRVQNRDLAAAQSRRGPGMAVRKTDDDVRRVRLKHRYQDLLGDLSDTEYWNIENAGDWVRSFNDLELEWGGDEYPLNVLELPTYCEDHHGNLTEAGITRMRTAVNRALEALTELPPPPPPAQSPPARPPAVKGAVAREDPTPGQAQPEPPTHAFIVHGRDPNNYRDKVARIINEATGLKATILHEQANLGRHLLTKFQEHAHEQCVAVVLMTGDDVGYLNSGGNEGSAPRPRQNVVLELGYFIAKLPPERVIVLREAEIDSPSDFAGVAYYELTKGWGDDVARELVAIGVEVNFPQVPRT